MKLAGRAPTRTISLLLQLLRILSYPFFILLHLLFIASSLLLRTYETFTSKSSLAEDTDQERRQAAPPRHLALILVPSKTRRKDEKAALVESILRAIEWSGEWGVGELSLWDGQGLTQSVLPSLMKTLSLNISKTHQNHLPISPPSTPPNGPTQDMSPEEEGPVSPSPRRAGGKSLVRKLESVGVGDEVRSVTIHPGTSSNRSLKLHFLPPSASSEIIVNLTKRYIERKKDVGQIDVKSVDRDIREQLHFTSDPDLLLIHHLSRPSLLGSLLPRSPPELWGYPFWSLRITEIYQYPSPLPLLHHLSPLITSFRSSSLPFLRKLGYSISVPPNIHSDGHGILHREEWNGAMGAWSKVEQRLGK
ncbi:hypothetical protein I302_103593 [Kwoniella bestiolae CBS 10118]|uniref:ditrans,polycis-polyprenyl diphosphate synthase [(2E,6E)-farnesyldiphosphate specific] n=1 Tax=Kwoniella bestiolae CBS 10118 TaxID=1296100 RepID=A0A1B9G8W1_9TREE|nr:hypothetical protein I302_02294 [Kwoniella bestiolae CBS 10118]OCF27452.1 hypothetical protein I302_02294 [Kwoniella bestiolae CBS 10118]